MAKQKTTKREVQEFLRENHVMTVATVGPKKTPYAGTVFFYATTRFQFYFVTKITTIKYKNILNNPRIAMVVTDRDGFKSIQASGLAKPVGPTIQLNRILATMIKVIPNMKPVADMVNRGEGKVIKVDADWVRWTDFKRAKTKKQPTSEEIKI